LRGLFNTPKKSECAIIKAVHYSLLVIFELLFLLVVIVVFSWSKERTESIGAMLTQDRKKVLSVFAKTIIPGKI
jgi:uncharacterized protein YggT (Ycf19 family)